jgi:acyl-CoA hydrolase
MEIIDADTLDFAALVRPGDHVLCGQGAAEPLTLTSRLVAAADAIGAVEVFVGPLFSDTFAAAGAGMRFASYGAMGRSAVLWKAGRLDVIPIHYSVLDAAFASGRMKADVVLLQLAPAPSGQGFSLGLANDYVAQAARHARIVLAEVNPRVPWTHGAPLPDDVRLHALVAAEHDPIALAPVVIGAVEQAIARNVAAIVPDRATLQIGIGAIPDAVLSGLTGHRDLGIHSGVIGDRVIELLKAGAITNAHKSRDASLTVTNTIFGTRRAYDHVHDNAQVHVRPAAQTHAYAVLAAIDRLIAVNSAIEVDLTGQVNAEVAAGAYVGGVGGMLDFTRGASASVGGRAIIALPATARNGAVSRIVPRLSHVTVPRSDVDVVATEHGVAHLRGISLVERARRLIGIADPRFRDALAHSVREGVLADA